jgi:hypothetical protein
MKCSVTICIVAMTAFVRPPAFLITLDQLVRIVDQEVDGGQDQVERTTRKKDFVGLLISTDKGDSRDKYYHSASCASSRASGCHSMESAAFQKVFTTFSDRPSISSTRLFFSQVGTVCR